jgi:antitoxin (DNA-binding transcriptional repressor) of toxin-antitoxin stability system
MSDYDIDDPKVRLADLVERAEKGETVTLTRGGKTVARVSGEPGPGSAPRAMPPQDLEAMRARAEGRPLPIDSVRLIREMRDEGP